jgi:hypothetical protein
MSLRRAKRARRSHRYARYCGRSALTSSRLLAGMAPVAQFSWCARRMSDNLYNPKCYTKGAAFQLRFPAFDGAVGLRAPTGDGIMRIAMGK